MRPMELRAKLEAVYGQAERVLTGVAPRFNSMHGSVMPRTYVGNRYGVEALDGKLLPKIFMISINQSRRGNEKKGTDEFDPNKVRDSLYEQPFEEASIRPNGFGPRALALNLGRWILMKCGIEKDRLTPPAVHDLIAYDNFVKWPFDRKNSKPPEGVWPVFYGINRAIVEILKPDIILCLGHPMYAHLSNALKRDGKWSEGYGWEHGEFAKRGWTGTLIAPAPWRACQLGRCYHYSDDRWARKATVQIRNGDLPDNLKELLGKPPPLPKELRKVMEEMDDDDKPDAAEYPWWGTARSKQKSVAKYHRYKKLVAWRVCEALAGAWRKHNESTEFRR